MTDHKNIPAEKKTYRKPQVSSKELVVNADMQASQQGQGSQSAGQSQQAGGSGQSQQ